MPPKGITVSQLAELACALLAGLDPDVEIIDAGKAPHAHNLSVFDPLPVGGDVPRAHLDDFEHAIAEAAQPSPTS